MSTFTFSNFGQVKYMGSVPTSKEIALEISIKKWEYIETLFKRGETIDSDGGPATCGLCLLFFIENCDGCTIREDTGKKHCDGTPYEELHNAMGEFEPTAELIAAEIAYLKGLRAKI